MSTAPPPGLEGWVQKRGEDVFRMWKQRWCVLDAANGKLHYFVDRQKVQHQGSIDLSDPGVSVVRTEGRYFEIRIPGRTYELWTDRNADCDMWLDHLHRSLSYLRQRSQYQATPPPAAFAPAAVNPASAPSPAFNNAPSAASAPPAAVQSQEPTSQYRNELYPDLMPGYDFAPSWSAPTIIDASVAAAAPSAAAASAPFASAPSAPFASAPPAASAPGAPSAPSVTYAAPQVSSPQVPHYAASVSAPSPAQPPKMTLAPGQSLPPQYPASSAQPGAAQGYPSGTQAYPGGTQAYPGGAQPGYPSGAQQGYPSGTQTYPNGQSYSGAQGTYPNGAQAYPAAAQAYSTSGQGYPGAAQTYPQQAYPYSAGYPQTAGYPSGGYPGSQPGTYPASGYPGSQPYSPSQPAFDAASSGYPGQSSPSQNPTQKFDTDSVGALVYHTPMRYMIKEKWLSMGGDMSISDAWSRKVFFVKGEVFTIGNKLSVQDVLGHEHAYIKQKLRLGMPHYDIYRNQQLICTVKQNFSLIRSSFEIELHHPNIDKTRAPDRHHEVINVKGDWMGYNFQFTRGTEQRLIASVGKSWCSMRDTYGVEIMPGEDNALILACVVVIDKCTHDRAESHHSHHHHH